MEWGNHHFSHIAIQLTLNIYRDRMSRKPKNNNHKQDRRWMRTVRQELYRWNESKKALAGC